MWIFSLNEHALLNFHEERRWLGGRERPNEREKEREREKRWKNNKVVEKSPFVPFTILVSLDVSCDIKDLCWLIVEK